MSFETLGLSQPILKAIQDKGYTTPSPIQQKAIPVVLKGKDILASARTGTGKTAGFTLPMLELLIKKRFAGKRPLRALVLTPTRELAAQILEDVKDYSAHTDIRSMVIFGGVNQKPQVAQLRQGVDILIATPGRLLDLHSQKHVHLGKIDFLVLDEADRMLDMGFLRDINRILRVIPDDRQNLLFSATFNKEIKKLATELLDNPVLVEATPENTTAEKVDQQVILVDKTRKSELIIKLISEGKWSQVLVFTRTKHGANRLAEKLSKKSISAAAIHGNKSQNARTKALADFKSGKVRILVATDIAARGLDIPLLPHVINFELPNVPEDYVHRIGRTGRAGASGKAISLVSFDERDYVKGIEKLLKQSFDKETVPGFEPTNAPELNPVEKKGRRNFSRKPKGGGSGKNGGGGNRRFGSGKSGSGNKPKRRF